MPYDLFISYSRRDNAQGRITQLVERIKKDFASFEGLHGRELVTFFDQEEIHGMQDWRQRILQGLRESRLLLACLSPAYLKSEYCEWEFVEYLKYEIGHLHGFNGVAPIYFVEVPGWDTKDFEQQCAAWVAELRKRQHFDLRPWHDEGEEALREAAVQERMGQLNRQLVQTITRGERAEKSLGNVDAHNPHFIGRTANLRMLRENFVTPGHIGVVTAVNGLGGLGKTALAIEYAHAFADEYGGGRWQVRCAGQDDLRLALAELAAPIGFEFTDDEKKNADLQFERTRRELKKLADSAPSFGVPPSGSSGFGVPPSGGSGREVPEAIAPFARPPKGGTPNRCLLILDNVDRPGLLDPAQVARLNGGDWLHVLATTRLGENELHGPHRDRSFLAVDELPPDDALALIESYQPDGRFRSEAERDAACEIVRLLGCFTLAVESAAVYLGQFANDVTCAAFLARLKKEGLEGVDAAASQSDVSVRHREKRLSATLQPTLERLSAAEELALGFAALLPPDQVPLRWLRALVAKTFPEMERDAELGYPDPWKSVLRSLFSLRLIQATDAMDEDCQPQVARIHRLMQQLAIRHCPTDQRNARQESLDSFVMQRIAAKRVFWVESWERSAISALATYWDEIKQRDVSSLRSFITRAFLGQLGWSSKGNVKEPAERAVELFNKAMTLQDWNQLQRSKAIFAQSIKYFSDAGNNYSATIAKIYFVVLLLELDEAEGCEKVLRKPEEFPDYLDVKWLLSRMSDRANVAAKKSNWEAAIRILQLIEEICLKVSTDEGWLLEALERQGEIYADNLTDYQKALKKFTEQEKLLLMLIPRIEKSNNAVMVFDRAVTLFEQHELDRSCDTFFESIRLFIETGSEKATNLAEVCFGGVLAEMEKGEAGKNAIQRIKDKVAGKHYYQNRLSHRGVIALEKLRQMFQQCSTDNAWGWLARCLGNQGVVLNKMKEHENSLAAQRKAERICREHDLRDGLVLPLARQAMILSDGKGDHQTALPLAEEAAELASQHSSDELRQEILGILDSVRQRIRTSA